MILSVFDLNFTPLGMIEAYQSCSWIRRFRSCGECQLSVPYSREALELLQVENLLLQQNGTEAMCIATITLVKERSGADVINVTAYSLLQWLNRRVVIRAYDKQSLTRQQIICKLFRENVTAPVDKKRILPYVTLRNRTAYPRMEKTEFAVDAYQPLLDIIEPELEASEMGCIVTTDTAARTHTFDFRLPRDRTASSASPIIFSVDYGTLGEQEFIHSHEQYYNTAYVTGGDIDSDNEEEQAYKAAALQIVNDHLSGMNRREILVTASDIRHEVEDDEGEKQILTVSQIRDRLQKRGKDELLGNYKEESTFNGQIVETDSLVYLRDWNLGDRVTCVYDRWGLQADMVITEVVEEYTQKGRRISATFGDGTPSFKKALCALIHRSA